MSNVPKISSQKPSFKDYKIEIENKIIDFFDLKDEQLYDIEPWVQVFLTKLNVKNSESEKVILDLYFYYTIQIKKDDFLARLENNKYLYFDELIEMLKADYSQDKTQTIKIFPLSLNKS
jgi:hypothetical protein